MREYLQMSVVVPRGDEIGAAREIWSAAKPEERLCLARLAAELVILHEAGGDQRIVIAPAEVLEAAGLPFAGASAGGARR